MYHANRAGARAAAIFEPAMAATAWAELAMESRLTQAVRDGEFVLRVPAPAGAAATTA
jgi:hypothetical protein